MQSMKVTLQIIFTKEHFVQVTLTLFSEPVDFV